MASEVFSQARMNRCMKIYRLIADNWRVKNRFEYVVKATEAVHKLSLNELRTKYFEVGIEGETQQVPLIDVLVIFSMIEQESIAMRELEESGKKPSKFSVNLEVTTDWPDDAAVRLLSQLSISTPFDPGEFLRIVAKKKPDSPEGTEGSD
jgi:hypothetical protein